MELELVLDSLAFGGEAVGRDAGGRVVFVAGGAPGDRVVARVVEDKRKFARAELVRVVAAGAARVVPPCPIVDRCGGCPWQHVDVAAQLAAKQAIVERALGKLGTRVEPIVPSPAALGYRTRARMTVRGGSVGFHGRRSHEIVDVERCLALDPRLDAAMQAARRTLGPLLGEDATISGLVTERGVEIAIHIGRRLGDWRRAVQTAPSLVGQEGIVDVTTNDVMAPAAGFAQANAAQNLTLQRLVREAARAEGKRVLELYAGDGNFTRVLGAASGVAVDRSPTTVRLPSWETLSMWADAAVSRLLRAGERFDVILLDPPRAGAAEVAGLLGGFGAARIVYVSCDPMTLARDLETLARAGYRATSAWPVDMMPQTWHVEVVALVER